MIGWFLKPLPGCFPALLFFFSLNILAVGNKWVASWLGSLLHLVVSGRLGNGRAVHLSFLRPIQSSIIGLRPWICPDQGAFRFYKMLSYYKKWLLANITLSLESTCCISTWFLHASCPVSKIMLHSSIRSINFCLESNSNIDVLCYFECLHIQIISPKRQILSGMSIAGCEALGFLAPSMWSESGNHLAHS